MSEFTASIGQTDFLELLSIQLKNQDPIDPVKQDDLVQQLTQFSTLEGIESLNTRFEDMLYLQELSQGVDLVGLEVQYQAEDSEEIKSGVVDGFFVEDQQLFLEIGEDSVPISRTLGAKTPTI